MQTGKHGSRHRGSRSGRVDRRAFPSCRAACSGDDMAADEMPGVVYCKVSRPGRRCRAAVTGRTTAASLARLSSSLRLCMAFDGSLINHKEGGKKRGIEGMAGNDKGQPMPGRVEAVGHWAAGRACGSPRFFSSCLAACSGYNGRRCYGSGANFCSRRGMTSDEGPPMKHPGQHFLEIFPGRVEAVGRWGRARDSTEDMAADARAARGRRIDRRAFPLCAWQHVQQTGRAPECVPLICGRAPLLEMIPGRGCRMNYGQLCRDDVGRFLARLDIAFLLYSSLCGLFVFAYDKS